METKLGHAKQLHKIAATDERKKTPPREPGPLTQIPPGLSRLRNPSRPAMRCSRLARSNTLLCTLLTKCVYPWGWPIKGRGLWACLTGLQIGERGGGMSVVRSLLRHG